MTRHRLTPLSVLLAFFFGTLAAAHAVGSPPVGEKLVYKTVPDKDGGARELVLYVTKPEGWKSSGQRPAIVFYHGGGWTGGAPGQFTEHAQYFASRGLVCFQVQYRLLDKADKTQSPENSIHDARSAFRWIRARADKFGIDPDRMASAGGSAGGHLAAHIGLADGTDDPNDDTAVSAKSNAMILFNPVFDNGPGGWGTARVGDRYPEFSPVHNISQDDPPAVVFLGSNDKLIPVATLEKFEADMTAAGVATEAHVYEGQPHGFFNTGKSGNKYYLLTVTAADKFLARLGWLEGPPTLDAE